MPRSGAGVYTLPVGLPSNGDTSNADEDLRAPLEDVATDLNTPRPIVAGGTGAATDVLARKNLGMASFKNLAALLANNTLLYSGTYALVSGDIITTQQEGFSYQVASSTATDHHLTTAGGVKLYVVADEEGGASVDAFGAVGDGVTDDRAVFIKAEASGLRPIRLSRSYFLSSNTGNTAAIYEIGANATVTMGAGEFQPARYTDNTASTVAQRVNFTATNPVSSGEPVTYTFMDGYTQDFYTINQWGRQNMVTPDIPNNRTGFNQVRNRVLHSGEGDGYAQFLQASVLPHSRIGSATTWKSQNSAGMANGQTLALGNKVNVYGFGDVVVNDQGYEDVSMFGHVTFIKHDGTNSGSYGIPRLGFYLSSTGANPIDANFLAGGPTKIAFDATKADVDWGAFAMKSGQSILFDATEAVSSVDGKFAATAAGSYTLSKPSGVPAFVFTRGADDLYLLRVSGSSATARAAVGSSGTVAYFSAHTTTGESTVLSLRTANAGIIGDRLIVSAAGNVNVATAGARLQMGGVSVLNARQTGWTAPTGTATRTTFDTATVTTAQLAERVKGLIDDLITHGLIGA